MIITSNHVAKHCMHIAIAFVESDQLFDCTVKVDN